MNTQHSENQKKKKRKIGKSYEKFQLGFLCRRCRCCCCCRLAWRLNVAKCLRFYFINNLCIFHKCFLQFFRLHLSSYFAVVVVVVFVRFAVYFGWNYSFLMGHMMSRPRTMRFQCGGLCVHRGEEAEGVAERCVCKGSTFSVNMAENQRVCTGGEAGGVAGVAGAAVWRSERGVNEHRKGRHSCICCCLCNSKLLNMANGSLYVCVCVSAICVCLFTHTSIVDTGSEKVAGKRSLGSCLSCAYTRYSLKFRFYKYTEQNRRHVVW